jgi:hypothetical protein
MQPSSDVSVKARRWMRMQARSLEHAQRCIATKGRPGRSSVKSLWSALQTHLQGVDRATLAIVPKKCRHRAALLSRLSFVKITRPAKESKPKLPPSQPGSRRGLKPRETSAIDSRGRRGQMSVPGHSRPSRADSRSGHVCHAPIATDFALPPNVAMCISVIRARAESPGNRRSYCSRWR